MFQTNYRDLILSLKIYFRKSLEVNLLGQLYSKEMCAEVWKIVAFNSLPNKIKTIKIKFKNIIWKSMLTLFLFKALKLKFSWRATCKFNLTAHEVLIQAYNLRCLLHLELKMTLANLLVWFSYFTNWKLRPGQDYFFSP